MDRGEEQARSYHVLGVVQGVGFRMSTVRTARELGLTGWVRNRPDGSVEVWAQGPAVRLRRLEAFLGRGPIGARVTRVDVADVDPDSSLTRFDVVA